MFCEELDLNVGRDVKVRLENSPSYSPIKTEKNISVDPSVARTRGGCC